MKQLRNGINSFLIPAIVILALFFCQTVRAETVKIPLQVNFLLLRQLLVSQLFQGPKATTELLHDPSGCSEIILADPQLSEHQRLVQIDARLKARLGVKVLEQCMPVLNWEGYAQILARPILTGRHSRVVAIQVVDSQLYSPEHKLLTSGPLWDQARKRIHPYFDRFRLNLDDSIETLKTSLPLFLPRHSQPQMNALLASIQLGELQVENNGIRATLQFQVNPVNPPAKREQGLTTEELQQWQQKWKSMDALLTYVIKHYAADTELRELRQTLFEILLDSRYQLQDALQRDQSDDPVRHWFVASWARLMPVIQKISASNPRQAPLGLMSLITATDALQALDKLGPSFGLDISMDGLRRLARIVNHSPNINPLNFDQKPDPELMHLFQFNLDNDDNPGQLNFNFLPIRNAFAATDQSLSQWVPNRLELKRYLSRVHKLLIRAATHPKAKAALSPQQQKVFRTLLLAAAWQESCWRQFIVDRHKIVPLRSSTGDTGILQINENVWRGFVDIHRLRWDIAYNIQSGSHILHHYMVQYAIKNGEQKYRGGLDNLARATYSAYNGGPGQVARYRNRKAPKAFRKIDESFHKKYQKVKQGSEWAVAECLGGDKSVVRSVQSVKKAPPPVSAVKQSARATKHIIRNENWIRKQAKKYFTLQLGVFSSRQAAERFIRQLPGSGEYAIYRTKKKTPSTYTVIFGRYSHRDKVEKERSRFGKIKPWIRSFRDITAL